MILALPHDRYDSLFKHYGAIHKVPWTLLKAVAWQESRFNPRAVSPVGAKGLCQFMPATWKEFAPGEDPFNPEASIQASAKYLSWLIARPYVEYPRGTSRLLAAYNAGPGRVSRAIKAKGAGWLESLPKETQDYVAKVQLKEAEYAQATTLVA